MTLRAYVITTATEADRKTLSENTNTTKSLANIGEDSQS